MQRSVGMGTHDLEDAIESEWNHGCLGTEQVSFDCGVQRFPTPRIPATSKSVCWRKKQPEADIPKFAISPEGGGSS